MIEKINDISQFVGYKIKDIYSVRIFSLINAYGAKYEFAKFYRQTDEKNNITAIISSLDNDVTVSFDEFRADKEEISQFICITGFSTVICDESLHMNFSFESGDVMKSEKKIEKTCNYTQINKYPELFDLYNFSDYDCNGFNMWYADISHRIRHGAAKAAILNIGDEIISSAIFSSIYNDDAIITAVKTNPKFRKMGYGSAIVSAMCADVRGTVYLMREKNKNESFYEKLGFKNIGNWRMYK